jgi:pimeloyl-ACP methyl ester carboxylesterase
MEKTAMDSIASRDGTRIAFRKSGNGPPLLLVHGTTADHSRWAGISPRLEARFTVHAMDRRGRGGSTDGPAYALQREAEDVAVLVDAMGGPALVLGHSYGALAVLEASLLTNRIRRLVLYEPPVPIGAEPYPPDVPGRMQALIDRGELEEGLLVFFREVVQMPEHELETYRKLPVWQARIRLAPTIAREMEGERNYSFEPGRFSRLAVPTLLLVGGASPPLFRNAVDALHSALPGSRVRVMPGQQHIAMDTAPDLFLEEVLGFFLE